MLGESDPERILFLAFAAVLPGERVRLQRLTLFCFWSHSIERRALNDERRALSVELELNDEP